MRTSRPTLRVAVVAACAAMASVVAPVSSRADGTDCPPFTTVAAGGYTTVVGGPGGVYAWGDNTWGAVGDGTTTNRRSPVRILRTPVTAVATTGSHSLALTTAGTVLAWGANPSGELGDGTTTPHLSPRPVPGLAGVVAVAVGGGFSLALGADGVVQAWGTARNGRLGDGEATGERHSPFRIRGLPRIAAVAAGAGGYGLAAAADGTQWAWGLNQSAQLGDGTLTDRLSPVRIDGTGPVRANAGGTENSFAIDARARLWAWGTSKGGQLGDGGFVQHSTPLLLTTIANVVSVAAGRYHSVAAVAGGAVYSWGQNLEGELGDGRPGGVGHYEPGPVPGLSGIVAVEAGTSHSLALGADGTVWAWGFNVYGQVGAGTPDESVPVPVQVRCG